MSSFMNTIQEVQNYGNEVSPTLQNVEKEYYDCAISYGDTQTCPSEISLYQKYVNLDELKESMQKLNESFYDIYDIDDINDITNISEIIEDKKLQIIEEIDNWKNEFDESMNFSEIDSYFDFSEVYEMINDIPSFVLPVATLILVLTPLLMILILVLQIFSFWKQNKFSRCCSFVCFPYGFCAIYQLVFAAVPAILGVVVILFNVVYDQGDDIVDTVIKNITNENRIIEFGTINLSHITNTFIGTFTLENVEMMKIDFIKNFLNAKLKTSLSKTLSLDQFPIEILTKMIEKSTNNAKSAINVDQKVRIPEENNIKDILEEFPPVNLDNIIDINSMKNQLSKYLNVVSCCQTDLISLNNEYIDFTTEISEKIQKYSNYRNKTEVFLKDIPNIITDCSLDLLIGLLDTIGSSLESIILEIIPIVDGIDFSWIIGFINIVRVRLFYPLLIGCMLISVSAHLYLIGMVLMTILLWYRRKGMGENEDLFDSSSSLKSSSTLYDELLSKY